MYPARYISLTTPNLSLICLVTNIVSVARRAGALLRSVRNRRCEYRQGKSNRKNWESEVHCGVLSELAAMKKMNYGRMMNSGDSDLCGQPGSYSWMASLFLQLHGGIVSNDRSKV